MNLQCVFDSVRNTETSCDTESLSINSVQGLAGTQYFGSRFVSFGSLGARGSMLTAVKNASRCREGLTSHKMSTISPRQIVQSSSTLQSFFVGNVIGDWGLSTHAATALTSSRDAVDCASIIRKFCRSCCSRVTLTGRCISAWRSSLSIVSGVCPLRILRNTSKARCSFF